MNQALTMKFNEEEVRVALFQMHPTKAPGADGHPGLFYQKFWSIVGQEVISKVLADRLKALPRTVISDNQSAFMPARLLTTDNVFIAFELFHFLKNQRFHSGGHLAVKLDMMLVNGVPTKQFNPTRGLRQGVALNRYSPRISHPLFADDSLLFAKATQNEDEKIMEIFYLYEQASGQKLNLEKSDIFFCKNVPEAE
ncbi:uncharacterized protein LOC130759966 [Actinidia eriantha]|uniref:uncharacterized protein LOC130759966 n=1 Tax=Actinidia eriantha TaxID=165200 RepID=UPI00258DA7DA|nr:uncharacterized protein LOC130759966 [Actinidia eriantha]